MSRDDAALLAGAMALSTAMLLLAEVHAFTAAPLVATVTLGGLFSWWALFGER